MTPTKPSRKLVVATIAAGGMCAAMLWALLAAPDFGSLTANIADVPASTSSGQALQEPVVPVPALISDGLIVSGAIGLEPDTVRYYEPLTGRAFVAHLKTGTLQTLSERKLSGFRESLWAPNAPAVISSFDVKGTVEYRHYDYADDSTAVVGTAVGSLAFSPDGHMVAYVDTVEGEGTGIYLAQANGTAARRLLATRAEDVRISWPHRDFVSMASRRPGRTGIDLTLIDTRDGGLKPLLAERLNLEYTWARDGQKLLFSQFVAGEGATLWYHDLSKEQAFQLTLPTSARKCAWHPDGMAITCGVPNKNGLTGDIPTDQVATNDDIVTMDIETGGLATQYTAVTGTLLGVIDPLVTSTGHYFAFPNVFDRKLYSIEL